MIRKIVQIDETRCNGCGLCVPSCAEGAIQIIDGKAKLVADVYCDGLGACLGHCPEGAISVIEREADDFDQHAAESHVARLKGLQPPTRATHGGCPGSATQSLLNVLPASRSMPAHPQSPDNAPDAPSGLINWPVQLHLVPPQAPYLRDAELLLVADCVPFAYAEFHRRFLHGEPVVIGCPKLDDARAYVEKLAAIIVHSSIRKLSVLRMEVPCCSGLMRIAQAARSMAGSDIPLDEVVVSIHGQLLEPAGAN
ncbi:MAG: 4Fe-4S binding protein [Thermoguttaceae bacterium]|nr:4Fe-4S binding protein [Thermoguttaceae bacterium]